MYSFIIPPFQLRNECLLWLGDGNWNVEQTNRPRTALSRKVVPGRFFCSALRFIPQWTQKKCYSFPIFTVLSTKTRSKITREKLPIKIPAVTSFNVHVLVTAHVIRQTAELLGDRGSSGIDLIIFSRVQRRICDTTVNIFKEWVSFFLRSWENELGWGTWQIPWTAKRFSEDLSLPHPSSFPMNADK